MKETTMRPVVVLPASTPEGAIDHAAYVAQGGYRLLKRCVAGEIEADMVLQSVGESGLRGARGPAAEEWQRVHCAPVPRAMDACVGLDDRGNGTGRELLQCHPHRCFEGMLIAAWAVGASRVRLLLARGSPAALRAMLAAELAKLRRCRPYPGMPDIVLDCRDAAPADDGVPTLRQGIETLYWVPDILERGAQWFASRGRTVGHERGGSSSMAWPAAQGTV
jgi:formate dehydrogenase